jgi:hypothetical protein
MVEAMHDVVLTSIKVVVQAINYFFCECKWRDYIGQPTTD